MLFLVEYNRKKGVLKTFKKFDDSEAFQAKKERLALELDLNQKNIIHEVVLFRANSEAEFRHTHSRYFDSLKIIANKMISDLKAA